MAFTSEVADLIKLVNVSKFYSTNNVIAMGLRKANLELHVNEFVAIVGESGSGKTTLLNVICGIDSYEEGEIYVNGEETSYFSTEDMENFRKKYVAFVFQNYNLIDSYTVLQNVEAPMLLAGIPRKEVRRRALEIIGRVGLSEHLRHRATRLSGGQKQRVVIARALAKDCPIIAADEPTGNLDSESGRQILELLQEISKDKLVILVTHDFDQVKHFATRKIRIYDGEIVEDIALRRADKQPLPIIGDAQAKIRFWQIVRMSFNNLLATPKKTFFLWFTLFIATFFVAWTYGAFTRSLDENREGYDFNYQNAQFLNTSSNRLVIRRSDGLAFTNDDLSLLEGFSGTRSVLVHDYFLDDEVAFVTGADINSYSDYSFGLLSVSYVGSSNPVMLRGVLPDEDDEVAIVLRTSSGLDPDDLMDTFISQAEDYKDPSDWRKFSVVGVLSAEEIGIDGAKGTYGDINHFVLMTDSVAREYTRKLYFNHITAASFSGTDADSEPLVIPALNFPLFEMYSGTSGVIIDATLPAKTLKVEGYYSAFYNSGCGGLGACNLEATGDLHIQDFYTETDLTGISIDYVYDGGWTQATQFKISADLADSIIYDEVYQVSLIANDETAANRITTNLEWLHAGRFVVVSPAQLVDSSMSISGVLEYLFTYLAALIGLVAVMGLSLLMTNLVTKLVYNTKMHDYAIFRTIGANQSIIRAFIFTENFMNTIGCFVLFLPLAIYLKNIALADTPFMGFQFYEVGHYFILFLILLTLSALNSNRYCRRVFKETVNKSLKVSE